MNNVFIKSFFIAIFACVFAISCSPSNKVLEKESTNNEVPTNKPTTDKTPDNKIPETESTNNEGSADIQSYFSNEFPNEIKVFFGIANNHSAFMATKKIDFSKPIEFGETKITDGEIVSYQDSSNSKYKGFINIKVSGTYKGQNFTNQIIKLDNLKNPYFGAIRSVSSIALNTNYAIEHNILIDDFIEYANSNMQEVAKNVNFFLDNNTKINLSELNSNFYQLELILKKSAKADKPLILQVKKYEIKLHSSKDGITDKVDNLPQNVSSLLTEDALNSAYFNEKDVFEYIASQEGLIKKTDFSNVFASEYYSFGKDRKMIPPIFNSIEKYQILYRKAGNAKKYLDIPNLILAIYNIENDGLVADDINGKLDFSWYVTTRDYFDLDELVNGSKPKQSRIEGFKKLDKNYLIERFAPIAIEGDKFKNKKWDDNKWLNYQTTIFIVKQQDNTYKVDDSINDYTGLFYVKFRHLNEPSTFFALETKAYLTSYNAEDEFFLLKNLILEKERNTDKIKLTFYVLGANGADEPIEIEISKR